MQLPTAPLTAFARDRLARYRYEVEEEGTPGSPAPGPERPFPVAWYGALLGVSRTSPPPPDWLSPAVASGGTFGVGEEEAGSPGGGLQARPSPRWNTEDDRLSSRGEEALSAGRASQRTSGGVPQRSAAGPVAVRPASADVSGPPAPLSVRTRVRRFLAQLGRELLSVGRGPQDVQEAAREPIPGPAGMSSPGSPGLPEPQHRLYPKQAPSPGRDAGSVGTHATPAWGPREAFDLLGVPPETTGAAKGASDEVPDPGAVLPSGFGPDAEEAGQAHSGRPPGRVGHGDDARESTWEGRREEALASPEEADRLARRMQLRMGRGAPLPSSTRRFLETVLRRPLVGLRVHTGGEEARVVRKMGAAAATLGREIVLSPDFPGLETSRGLELLAHEAVHAIQAAERGPAYEGAPEAREEEAEALRAQMAVREHLQRSRLRVSVPPPPSPTFPELPVARAPGRAEVPLPVTAVPSFGPFRRAPAEETVTPAPSPPPAAEPSPAPDVEALTEEVYRRLRYRLELEREQRGIG